MNRSRGVLLVVSGPSGVGKGTICAELIRQYPDVFLSISATSRPPRTGEQDGVHYFFKTPAQFEQMIQENEFLEYVHYITSSYGTPKGPCIKQLDSGNSVVLEIEVQGALKIKEQFPETVLIFVLPPDWETLEQRLRGRGTEDETLIQKRLLRAKEELELMGQYDYLVTNDTVPQAVERLHAIITAEQLKVKSETISTIKKELIL